MSMKKRMSAALAAVLAAGLIFTGGISFTGPNPVYAVSSAAANVIDEYTFTAAPGAGHSSLHLQEGGSLQALQVLEVDPKASGIEVRAVSSRMEVSRGETVGYMVKEQEAAGRKVVGAVNGDFFSSVGVPSGLQISDGELISSPGSIKALMYVLPDGSVHIEENVSMTAVVKDLTGESSSLDIDMINRSRVPSHNDRAFLFTDRFGDSTRTPAGGVEAVLKVEDRKLKAGQPVKAVVQSVDEAYNTPIGDGQYVLSASGTKADWVRSQLSPGDEIEVSVGFDKGLNEAREVISGNSTLGRILLKDGEIPAQILDPAVPANKDRHPRTMVGVTAAGKLIMVVADGRSPGYADGMTFEEEARYLLSLGAVDAINIDGGGSSTYYVRQPGDGAASLMNVPSDGSERPVGNALMVISKAPDTGKLSRLTVTPNRHVQVAYGSTVDFTAKGQDKYYNPVAVKPAELEWSASGGVGKVNNKGVLTAASKEVTGEVKVHSEDGITGKVTVKVTNQIASVKLSHQDFAAEPGSSQQLLLRAYDADGKEILLSPSRVAWKAEGDIGTVAQNGVFTAAAQPGTGTITASYGGLNASVQVEVGPSPVLEPFESLQDLGASEVRTVPGSVALSLVSAPDPVRFGQTAGKLTYDFTGTSGTSAAYVNLLDQNGDPGRAVPGKPKRIGVWVVADGNMHQLRLGVTDGNGASKLWNLTALGGTNWTGEWRYVSAEVPADTVFPIQIRNIAMEEKNVNNKQAGVLYYDDLTAEYADQGNNGEM